MKEDSFLSKLEALGEMEIDFAVLFSIKPGGFSFWLIDLVADVLRSIFFAVLGLAAVTAPMLLASEYVTNMEMQWKMLMVLAASIAASPLVMSSNLIFWSCLGEETLCSIWKDDVSLLEYNLRAAYKKLGFFSVQAKIWASAFCYFFWTLFRIAIAAIAILALVFLYQSLTRPIV